MTDKAAELRALQARLAQLEKAKQIHKNSNPIATTTQPSAAPVPVPVRSALEEAKALLAAKIAAKENKQAAANGTSAIPAAPSKSTLSANAPPFTPANHASASSASIAASSTPASAAPGGRTAPVKVQLCRKWLTCEFGSRCRFLHPTVQTEPFFEYGGRILLHLNAAAVVAAASAGIADAPPTANATMPPVLLLVLALIAQSRQPDQQPSMPLNTLWSTLREQLAGTRDLPASQDDLLNSMGLPTTAAVLVRSAEGQPVLSTDAFRNMYASVFVVTRTAGAFVVSHQWDEAKRARLIEAAEAAEAITAAKAIAKPKRSGPSSSSAPRSSPNAMQMDDGDDLNRKRKRVTDAELDAPERPGKAAKLGVLYPEDAPAAIALGAATSSTQPAAAASVPSSLLPRVPAQPGGIYSLDAGALGGTTAFVRGGVVTELSLLAPSAALRAQEKAAAAAAAKKAQPVYEDEFTRAIRRQREVSTHATYTVRTKQIASGKGFDMLQRMNWRNGQGLGKRQQGRVEPLEITLRAERTGI